MSDAIQCTGNDLNAVLERLRADEKHPWALDTGIGSNAGYLVEYFERVPELAPAIAVRQCVDGIISPAGENPVALTNRQNDGTVQPSHKCESVIATRTDGSNVAAGDDEGAEKPKSVPDAPALDLPVAAPAPLCEFCGGSLSSDGTCEICARLWRIREKAVQNRRVYKPKRGNDHARLPHPND